VGIVLLYFTGAVRLNGVVSHPEQFSALIYLKYQIKVPFAKLGKRQDSGAM
jgi:hypothetical protein